MIKAKPATAFSGAFELTPLIDIIFIVVVFLLLTANSQLFSVKVDIPSSDSTAPSASISAQTMTLSLRAEAPFWAMNEQRFNDWQQFKPALLAAIKTSNPGRQFNIATDKHAAVEPLIKLLSLLNEQGITNTHILMEAQP